MFVAGWFPAWVFLGLNPAWCFLVGFRACLISVAEIFVAAREVPVFGFLVFRDAFPSSFPSVGSLLFSLFDESFCYRLGLSVIKEKK